jgi:hypothetical protein
MIQAKLTGKRKVNHRVALVTVREMTTLLPMPHREPMLGPKLKTLNPPPPGKDQTLSPGAAGAAAKPDSDDGSDDGDTNVGHCEHNHWDNIRVKKGIVTLACRYCKSKWKLKHPIPMKCPDFYKGYCPLGPHCPYVHIHRFKSKVKSPDAPNYTPGVERDAAFAQCALEVLSKHQQPNQVDDMVSPSQHFEEVIIRYAIWQHEQQQKLAPGPPGGKVVANGASAAATGAAPPQATAAATENKATPAQGTEPSSAAAVKEPASTNAAAATPQPSPQPAAATTTNPAAAVVFPSPEEEDPFGLQLVIPPAGAPLPPYVPNGLGSPPSSGRFVGSPSWIRTPTSAGASRSTDGAEGNVFNMMALRGIAARSPGIDPQQWNLERISASAPGGTPTPQ